ncbi:hypothetical protein T439DRAFT_178355 [Meredithblackwellia eburnea MCA 4105]
MSEPKSHHQLPTPPDSPVRTTHKPSASPPNQTSSKRSNGLLPLLAFIILATFSLLGSTYLISSELSFFTGTSAATETRIVLPPSQDISRPIVGTSNTSRKPIPFGETQGGRGKKQKGEVGVEVVPELKKTEVEHMRQRPVPRPPVHSWEELKTAKSKVEQAVEAVAKDAAKLTDSTIDQKRKPQLSLAQKEEDKMRSRPVPHGPLAVGGKKVVMKTSPASTTTSLTKAAMVVEISKLVESATLRSSELKTKATALSYNPDTPSRLEVNRVMVNNAGGGPRRRTSFGVKRGH